MKVELKDTGFEMVIDLKELEKSYNNVVEIVDDDTGKTVRRKEISKVKAKKLLKLVFTNTSPYQRAAITEDLEEYCPKLYKLWLEVSL